MNDAQRLRSCTSGLIGVLWITFDLEMTSLEEQRVKLHMERKRRNGVGAKAAVNFEDGRRHACSNPKVQLQRSYQTLLTVVVVACTSHIDQEKKQRHLITIDRADLDQAFYWVPPLLLRRRNNCRCSSSLITQYRLRPPG